MDAIDTVGPVEFKIFTGLLKAARTPEGGMRLKGTASSTVKDLHGDTMLRSALEDMHAAANNNLTIFLNHSYNVPEDVAGSTKSAELIQRSVVPDEIWDLDLEIEVNAKNPRAVEAFGAIEGGTKLGLSIGAMIPEGGATRDKETGAYKIAHVDLLETSIVGIPANPRSWVQNAVKAIKSKAASQTVPLGNPTLTLDGNNYRIEGSLDNATASSANATITHNIDVTIESPTPEELAAAPAAEPDICGERNEDDSVACTADPGHEGNHSWGEDGAIHPDVTDAKIQVITIDTDDGGDADSGSSQGASDSEPEPEPVSDSVVSGAEPASSDMTPVVTSLTAALGMLESTASDLVNTRRQLAEAEIARDAAMRERDEVLGLAFSVITETGQIIEKLADIPVGRRAVVRQAQTEFMGLERIYSPAILKLMRGSNGTND